MAECELTIDQFFGAGTAVTNGSLGVTRLERGSTGAGIEISAEKLYAVSYPHRVIRPQRGELYRFREIKPNGLRFIAEVPDEATALYSSLEPLSEVPGGSGAYVVSPRVAVSTDGLEPAGLVIGDYWIVDNPALSTHGDLNQKTS